MRFGPALVVAVIWTLVPCSIASLGAAGTPLIDAVRSRDAARVKALVKSREDVNAPQGDGSTALHWAAHLDDAARVDYLIESRRRVLRQTEHGEATDDERRAAPRELRVVGDQPHPGARGHAEGEAAEQAGGDEEQRVGRA